MLLNNTTFVVTDTETTGLSPVTSNLIEIAAVKVRNGEVIDSWQQLINPERSIPQRISQMTGITTAMVFDQPTAGEVLPGFLDFLEDGVLVAHNLTFDERFIQAELIRNGFSPVKNPTLCTLRLARRLLPSLPRHDLGTVGKHFGLTNRARHRALGDAEVTAGALIRFLERISANYGIEELEELLTFQHKRYRKRKEEPRHIREIRQNVLPKLPPRPGVYTFRHADGRVLYVGKAKSLADRVKTYFTAIDSHPGRLRRLVHDVRSIEWTETGSELGALLLESHRIKTLRPRDNRAGIDYRDFPFIRLEISDEHASLEVSRGIMNDQAEYYGPISSRALADEVVDLALTHFGWWGDEIDTSTSIYADPAGSAYRMDVERIRRFLNGDGEELLSILTEKMLEEADRLDFEAAGRTRDRIRRLEHLLSRRKPLGRPIHELHGILIEPDARGGDQLFILHSGRIVKRLDGFNANPEHIREAVEKHLSTAKDLSNDIKRTELDELHILAHWLRDESRVARFIPLEDLAHHQHASLASSS